MATREIYTTEELAKRCRTSEATIRRLVKGRKIRPIPGFKQPYRFTDEEVRRFLYGKTKAA